jgi:hypothetical protein
MQDAIFYGREEVLCPSASDRTVKVLEFAGILRDGPSPVESRRVRSSLCNLREQHRRGSKDNRNRKSGFHKHPFLSGLSEEVRPFLTASVGTLHRSSKFSMATIANVLGNERISIVSYGAGIVCRLMTHYFDFSPSNSATVCRST